MATQRNKRIVIIVDGASRFTFATIAEAQRFAERMTQAHRIDLEFV